MLPATQSLSAPVPSLGDVPTDRAVESFSLLHRVDHGRESFIGGHRDFENATEDPRVLDFPMG